MLTSRISIRLIKWRLVAWCAMCFGCVHSVGRHLELRLHDVIGDKHLKAGVINFQFLFSHSFSLSLLELFSQYSHHRRGSFILPNTCFDRYVVLLRKHARKTTDNQKCTKARLETH